MDTSTLQKDKQAFPDSCGVSRILVMKTWHVTGCLVIRKPNGRFIYSKSRAMDETDRPNKVGT